jgi:hypothetical protein
MTKLLEKAFYEAAKLSDIEQNMFAQWVLGELESERKWEKAFSESEDVLSALADEALSEHEQGKTKPLNLDKL